MQKEVEITLLPNLVPPCPPGIIFTIGLGFHFTIFLLLLFIQKPKSFKGTQRGIVANDCTGVENTSWGSWHPL